MPAIKNEHLVWAYGQREDKSWVLIIGITDDGIKTLQDKLTLLVNPPALLKFSNVIIFHEKDKATLKQLFRETGLPITETDFNAL